MRTTVEIPDALYRKLKARAAAEGRSVKALVLESVENTLRTKVKKHRGPIRLPIIRSKAPGTLVIDNAKIAELLFP